MTDFSERLTLQQTPAADPVVVNLGGDAVTATTWPTGEPDMIDAYRHQNPAVGATPSAPLAAVKALAEQTWRTAGGQIGGTGRLNI